MQMHTQQIMIGLPGIANALCFMSLKSLMSFMSLKSFSSFPRSLP